MFAAIGNLIARGDVDRERFELRLVGSDFRGPAAGSALEELPVATTGYVDHRRAVAEMASSDVLLLYQPPGWPGASGKLYEYLATGRPILCVAAADSVPSRLVRELDAGECATPDDPAAIEAAIAALYRRWQDDGLGVITTFGARHRALLARGARRSTRERSRRGNRRSPRVDARTPRPRARVLLPAARRRRGPAHIKFVKYLPAAGYDPVVVTTTGIGHGLRDPGLAADVPSSAVVLRAGTVPLHVAKWKLEAVLRRLGLPSRLAQATAWPDEFVGWAPGAL